MRRRRYERRNHPIRSSETHYDNQPDIGGGGTLANDPIFAAIEKHRIAVQAIDDWPGDPPKELLDRSYWSTVQLAITKPTTLAGVMAILRYSHNNEFSVRVNVYSAR